MVAVEEHLRTIEKALLSGERSNQQDAWRTASWARCLRHYSLDPSHPELVQLEEPAIRHERDFFGHDIHIAAQEIEKTLSMIESGGYSAHVTNSQGVIIEERCSRDQTYLCSMDRIGSLWTEEVGGTNGIGISLVTEKAAAVYLTEHFFAEMTGQACVAAPFFDPMGELLGVINLSTRNLGVPQETHRIVAGIAQVTAERLEMQYFRKHFGKYHTVHLDLDSTSPCILAVDDDFGIVGATRAAREKFRLGSGPISQKGLWSLFEKLRGELGFSYLRENLRQLRPLGESATVGASLMQPQSALSRTPGLPMPQIVQKSVRPQAASEPTLAQCAGKDPVMLHNIEIMRRMSGAGLHLLLLGETGVGKDTLARAIHLEGDRRGNPFVAFNCAAIPESLIDSELFGYNAGAFTGANRAGSLGRVVEADRGTLFLDEIGDMPLPLQTRLLRFLETHEVSPLGGGKLRHVDVQVIAATHQNLPARVADGSFRQDLYYRLAGATIQLPALRDREDLPELVMALLTRLSEGRNLKIAQSAMERLTSHAWPGNIRELRNVLNRAVRLCSSNEIQITDLMFDSIFLTNGTRSANAPRSGSHPGTGRQRDGKPARSSALNEAERRILQGAISEAAGDAERCAAILRYSRATLYRKLKAHGLSLN